MAELTLKAILDAYKAANPRERQEFDRLLKKVGPKGDDKRGSGKLSAAVDTAASTAANAATDVVSAVTNLQDILSPMQALTKQVRMFREENENLFQAGYSDEMFNFTDSMEAAAKESYRLTGNFKAFAATQDAMRTGFKGLGFASKDFRKSIMETGVALSAAGFEMGDFAEIIDSAAFAFNKSEGQIKDLSATLIKTSRDFAIAPRELTENFKYAQKNFAYTSGKFMNNFLQLQKMSRTTGVAFQTLASSFGHNMDTFEGSAQMAGRLNQILGKSMFNSIDLLNKTEAERAEVIKKGILDRFGNRVGELQKFELKAIGASLNMSVEETRRFLRGEPPKAAKDMKKLQDKDPVKMASANLGNELDLVAQGLEGFRMEAENTIIKMSSGAFSALRAGFGAPEGKSLMEAANRHSANTVGVLKKTFPGGVSFKEDSPLLSMSNSEKLMTLVAFNVAKDMVGLGTATLGLTAASQAGASSGFFSNAAIQATSAISDAATSLLSKMGINIQAADAPMEEPTGIQGPSSAPAKPRPARPKTLTPSTALNSKTASLTANEVIINSLVINGEDLGRVRAKSGAPKRVPNANRGGQ